MKNVLCFGELLLRMSPALQQQWLQQNSMPFYVGGAELNVAQALAAWKVPVKYCTALPANYLSGEIEGYLQNKGVDTSAIIHSGKRIGMYFLPQGADLKHNSVIYDRVGSSFATLQPNTIDWDEKLANVEWLHFTAISPAIDANIVAVCHELLKAASAKNITISVDLNYRGKLWQWGKHPVEVMQSLLPYCDLVMANIWSANTLLGIEVDEHIHDKKSKEAYTAHAFEAGKKIMKQYPTCKTVANTFRFERGEGIEYFATLQHNKQEFVSKDFYSDKIVDKAGSGDCFMAGLIYGLQHNEAPQSIVDFAASAAFGKLHEKGDATAQTVDAIKQRIHNG